jgi:hypothetical protein
MVTYVSPYCQVHGLDLAGMVSRNGLTSSGGTVGVDEITSPDRKCSDIRNKGRSARKYLIKVATKDREIMEDFLGEVNTIPEDSHFHPFDADRYGLVASAFATMKPKRWISAGVVKILFEGEAEITCRESWLLGEAYGLEFAWNVPLPAVSSALTASGHERVPIAYFQCSGDYANGYMEDLSVRVTPGTSDAEHDRELVLCEKMLRGDHFEMGYRGEVLHSWQAKIISMAGLTLDLHGKTSGGSVTSGVLTLDNSDYLMMPFYGPLPVSGEAGATKIELTVDEITGDGATACVANETDLFDMVRITHDPLVVGQNLINLPYQGGNSYVAIGIQAAAVGSVKISAIKGMVRRYVAPSKIPYADPGEAFKIRAECTSGQRLRFLQARMNDRYYY